MLIIGAKGFSIQITDVLLNLFPEEIPVYFDDIHEETLKFLNRFEVLKNFEAVSQYLKFTDNRFILGIGGPAIRKMFFEKFSGLGGAPFTVIAKNATIGKLDVQIGEGSTILTGSIIESTVQIGKGCLINVNTNITHGGQIGDFCEISPGVNICGDCEVGEGSFLGTGVIVLPKFKIGRQVTVGAGSVVKSNIPDFAKVKGNPAR
ncbi:MAG: acetyltransferase [Chitinophagaceae bacterium]